MKLQSRKSAKSVKTIWRNFISIVISLMLVAVTVYMYAVHNVNEASTVDWASMARTLETSNEGSSSILKSAANDSKSISIISHPEPSKNQIHSDLFLFGANDVWKNLVDEAVAYRQENNDIAMNLMEVGMHSATQCLHIARNNLQAYCVEPSPRSRRRILRRFNWSGESVRKNVRFFQMAASSESGAKLKFYSSGGTGDYVGDGVDTWEMKKVPQKDSSQMDNANSVIVKSVAIDDIVHQKVAPTIDYTAANTGNQQYLDKMFVIKIDTQGFEPSVFSGLVKTIEEHKADFIMTEFWPKGIDFMNDATEKCQKPVEILQLLAKNGYQLFSLANAGHASSLCPRKAKIFINNAEVNEIPYHDSREFCMWFYKVEEMFPSPDYKMGYWTDILAVSPNARLAKLPVSDLGRILQQYLGK